MTAAALSNALVVINVIPLVFLVANLVTNLVLHKRRSKTKQNKGSHGSRNKIRWAGGDSKGG